MKATGKLTTLFIVSIMALTSTSVGYAMWSEILTIDGTVETTELDWEFYNYYNPGGPPTFTHDDHGIDPDFTKDVGSNSGIFSDTDNDGDYDTMLLTISNAYPQYHDHISFWVHCNGLLPLKIWKVIFMDATGNVVTELTNTDDVYLDLDGDGNADIRIMWGNSFGMQMHYCDFTDMSFGFIILQEAPQGATMTFSIGIVAVQYNEYPPP